MNYQLYAYISNRKANVLREVRESREAEVTSANY